MHRTQKDDIFLVNFNSIYRDGDVKNVSNKDESTCTKVRAAIVPLTVSIDVIKL